MAFHDDIILQEVSSGLFATEIIEDYWIIVGPNGGYLGALITNAAEMHLERVPIGSVVFYEDFRKHTNKRATLLLKTR